MLSLVATLKERIVVPGPGYLAYWPLNAAAGVCGAAAILGYGARLATVDGPVFRYLREAVLPVYILHQVVIVVLAYWLVALVAPVGVRFLVLLAASVAVTFALYHGVIRPLAPLRFLLGLRPRPSAGPAGRHLVRAVEN